MDPSQLQPGYRLDRYELLCPLAYGGMASVWLARFGGRLGFERMVVIKMILPQYSQDPRFQEMFLDEARIASRIEHTNVARILDVGEHDGSYYIVMEWVDGDSLSKMMRAAEQRKQRVPTGVALRVLAEAAAGLHAAHILKDRDGSPLNVVHRDVSPQNILISNAGATMLIDFGVAKARDRVSQETSAGQLKGKIRYMAPEQALGQEIDHRADVWALGSILYEIFAGGPPYDGPNEVATLHKLTSGAAPAPLPHDVPVEVQAIIARALAWDPNDRYASALELNLALEAAMVQIGEVASNAVVANYTGHLLSERKAARKRAVDAALAQARGRDQTEPFPTGEFKAIRDTAPLSSRKLPPPAPSAGSLGSYPTGSHSAPRQNATTPPASESSANGSGPLSLGESPSAASQATLGSAAVEFPPRYSAMPPKKKSIVGVVLGISAAAGLVGAVLIAAAVLRMRAQEPLQMPMPNAATTTTAAPVVTTTAPPETATAPAATNDPAPTTTATGTAAPNTTTTATTTATTVAAAPTTTSTSTSGSSHSKTPSTAKTSKTASTAATTTSTAKNPDKYGF